MNKKETKYEKVIRKVEHLQNMAYKRWVHVNHLSCDEIIDEAGIMCDIMLEYLQSNYERLNNNDKNVL